MKKSKNCVWVIASLIITAVSIWLCRMPESRTVMSFCFAISGVVLGVYASIMYSVSGNVNNAALMLLEIFALWVVYLTMIVNQGLGERAVIACILLFLGYAFVYLFSIQVGMFGNYLRKISN